MSHQLHRGSLGVKEEAVEGRDEERERGREFVSQDTRTVVCLIAWPIGHTSYLNQSTVVNLRDY